MEPTSYSGAGGKIRRRPFSRASASATPYDRPPAAAAAHRLAAAAAAAAGGGGGAYQGPGGEGDGQSGGWVSRLVDPASRLIAGGAARLFSTVFRKRLAPAPAPASHDPSASANPGRDAEPKQDLPESTHTGLTQAGGMSKGKDPVGTSGDKALSEVEHLLMRKTFTRVEFDRLTDLLRARTVESDLSAQVDHREDKEETRTRIDRIGGSTSHGMALDHSPPADVPVRGATSPADLAKQYMSSRYLKESQPSSLRSQLFLGNKAEAGNTGYYRTSGAPLVQEVKEFNKENPGLPVNGYLASGLRGRSAICRMSRSPFFKGPSSSSDMNVSPFSSSHARTPSLAADGRQVLKRRGSDFENELGSIGPIRRIRQKSNMMSLFKDNHRSPRGNFPPSRTIGSDFAEGSSPLQQSPSSKRLLLETGQSLRTVGRQRNSEDGKSSSDNVPPVAPQPNKMAEKIFEQLNRIAPSPKEKQSGQRSASRDPSQSMSKQPVQQDNGPKGVSDPSSSRQFDLDGDRPHDSDLNGSTLNEDKPREDGSSKVPSNTFQDSGNKSIKFDHVANFNKPVISGNSVSATTSRKPGFKMAVFEDLYEFDDDQEEPVPSKNSIFESEVKTTEQKFSSKIKERKVNIFEQKVESTLSKDNAISSSVSEQLRTSTSKDVSTSGLFSSRDPEKKATHVPANNNIGFTFPHVPPGDSTEATGSAVPLASNKGDKQTSASPFMFDTKPSSTSDLETSTAGVKTEGRLGGSVTKTTSLDNTNLERSNGRKRAGDIHKSPDKESPTAPPTSTPPLQFSSVASTSPSLSNGLSRASPPKLSNIMPADKPAVSAAPFTNITSFAVSSSSSPVSSSVPAFPTFNYGSSTSAVAAAKSESTSTETKPASTSFGSLGNATEGKSVAPEPVSKTSSNLNTASIFSSNMTTFSSSPVTSSSTFLSTAAFSSSPVASSGAGLPSTTSAPSTTLATTPGVQSASAPAFAFSSSGNSIFGFSSPAQSAGLSTTVGGSTSQPSAASTIFGSNLPQPQGTMPQSSATQFSSSFPTVATGTAASSSGPGTVSFGAGASASGPGTLLFGAGASSSGPGTVSFGAGASSSGPGSVSVGVGASSAGPGLFSFGAGVPSSGPGPVSFGAAPSSSGPGTVSFGVTTSSSGPAFGNSPFGSGAAVSGSASGFAFSSPSSSAASSLTVASTSMFSSSSAASSSAAFSNPFGSTSSTPSMFTFGQPAASSGGAFSFGAQSAPAFSSPSSQVYSFTSSSMNSSTPQPAFGVTHANMGFGMGSPGNDQMSMEDSMADDNNQAAPPQVPAPVFGSPLFGQPASSPAAPVFGAPAVQQPAGVFQFGGQQGSVQQNPSFAPPAGGSLEFQGGNFSLGSTGGGDKSGRRIIKPKRTQRKK